MPGAYGLERFKMKFDLFKKMKAKKGDIEIETIVKIAILVLMVLILLFLIFRNSEAMKAVWAKITGAF